MADQLPVARELWVGERARLRAPRVEDAELFDRWNLDPEWSFSDGFAYPPLADDHNRRFIEQVLERTPDPHRGQDLRLIIEDVASGDAAGSISTHHANQHNRSFMYGIAIGREHRGKGLASEAILLVVRYYFEELGYQRVQANVWAYNDASRRLHESLGFVLEGTLRRTHYRAGRFHDELVFGMLAEEFAARHGEWSRRTSGSSKP